jgi:hypothetical protein
MNRCSSSLVFESEGNMQHCLLCGVLAENTSTCQPGLPFLCKNHAWRELRPGEIFSVEEARIEGIKRVAQLSRAEIRDEGMACYEEILKWEHSCSRVKLPDLKDYYTKVIAAMKAYLAAFD